MKAKRFRCNVVSYRKGFLEVVPGIHSGFINLESWQVHPDADISELDIRGDEFPDDAVVSNTELELDIATAEALIRALQEGIDEVRKRE